MCVVQVVQVASGVNAKARQLWWLAAKFENKGHESCVVVFGVAPAKPTTELGALELDVGLAGRFRCPSACKRRD